MSTSPGSTLFAMDETSAGPDPVAVDDDGTDVPEEFDPNPGETDIDDGAADTGGLPFEPTRPIPMTAAMVTTAAPTRAPFRSRWERRESGGGGGAIHVESRALGGGPSSPSMFDGSNSASVISFPSSVASTPLRRREPSRSQVGPRGSTEVLPLGVQLDRRYRQCRKSSSSVKPAHR